MLFCNAPFLNNQKPYMILRCKRKGWYLGENMYVWLAAFLYMLFISLISLIAVLPTVSTNRLWGEIAGDFVVNQRSLIPVYTWGLVMPVRVIQNYYPLAAFTAVFFIMLDPVAVYFTNFKNMVCLCFSPINWSSLENINTVSGYPHLSGEYMFIMYIILIGVESLLSYICSIKMDIEVKMI